MHHMLSSIHHVYQCKSQKRFGKPPTSNTVPIDGLSPPSVGRVHSRYRLSTFGSIALPLRRPSRDETSLATAKEWRSISNSSTKVPGHATKKYAKSMSVTRNRCYDGRRPSKASWNRSCETILRRISVSFICKRQTSLQFSRYTCQSRSQNTTSSKQSSGSYSEIVTVLWRQTKCPPP